MLIISIFKKKKKKLAPTADHKPPLEFMYTDFVTKDVQEDIIKSSTDTHSQISCLLLFAM